jgi:two-component system LytT family response regulator
MRKLNVIIVDDEEKARSLLRNFILEFCPNLIVVGLAEDVKTAVKLINNNQIDVVFLDIEMPNENGFTLFEYFNNPTFKTIFCTAYSDYALKAFEVSAVDYILKPIGIKKLQEAVAKLDDYKFEQDESIQTLKENFQTNKINKIGVYVADATVFYNLEDIYYFEAEGSYTRIIHKSGKDLAVKKIKYFEDLLSGDNRFFRIHRSYFVNISQIKKYTKKEGPSVIFNDEKLLPVARERKEEFEEYIRLNNFF